MASSPDDTVAEGESQDEQIVLGVDTHADVHVAAVITVLGHCWTPARFPPPPPATRPCWPGADSHGRLRRSGVEGTSSHGTALNRFLARNTVRVIEVNRPDRAVRRRRGKTDAIDAENAARAVLTDQATAVANAATARSR